MTREEAKEILTHNWTRVDNPNYSESELDEAFFMAIEALTSQNLSEPNNTCEVDLISRADAMGAVRKAEDEAILFEENNDARAGYVAGFLKTESILSALPSAEAVQGWIPFKKRPLTDEEREEYPDWIYIFDCPLPDDEEEILLSNGKYVWTDTFINDGECYLDGGDDIDEGMAWMPLPKPYRKDGEA